MFIIYGIRPRKTKQMLYNLLTTLRNFLLPVKQEKELIKTGNDYSVISQDQRTI